MLKSFCVENFNDETRTFRLDVEMDALSFEVTPLQAEDRKAIAGFLVDADGKRDFIVTLEMKNVDGLTVPDEDKGDLIGLDGTIYHANDILKSDFMDLLIVRRIRVFQETGLSYARWYMPNWRDWLIPSDPMMPWGGDFYRYLHDRLGRRHEIP